MIIYTVRGGVSAVIWTDVVQMFVYVGGALLVFFGLLDADSRRLGRGGPHRRRQPAISRCFDFSTDPHRVYTFWAGLFGGIALTLATHGTDQFLVQRLLSARSRPRRLGRADPERRAGARAVRAVPRDRRDALHVLSAHAAAASARPAPTRSCRCSWSRRCRRACPASSSRPSSPRRCRRRSIRSRRRRSTTSI